MSIIPSLLSGFTLMASLIVAVGAQNTFVLRQGLRRDHVGGVVLICIVADIVLTSAGVAGLGTVLRSIPGLMPALTLGGTAFLCWYGVNALRRALRPATSSVEDAAAGRLTRRAALVRAAGFTLLNPHVYLDTVLFLGMVGAAQPAGARPSFVIGAALASTLWFATLGYGARLVAPLFARPMAWRVLDGGVAVLMLVLAGALSMRMVAGIP